jgi:hypothetical protein
MVAGEEAAAVLLMRVRARFALEKFAFSRSRSREARARHVLPYLPLTYSRYYIPRLEGCEDGKISSGSNIYSSNNMNTVISNSNQDCRYKNLSSRVRNHQICMGLHSMSRGLRCFKDFILKRRRRCAMDLEIGLHMERNNLIRRFGFFVAFIRDVRLGRESLRRATVHWDSRRLVGALKQWLWFKQEKADKLAVKRIFIDRLREGEFQAIMKISLVQRYGSYLNIMSVTQISRFLWRMSFLSKTFSQWRSIARATKHYRRHRLCWGLAQMTRSGFLRSMERNRDELCLVHRNRWELSKAIAVFRVLLQFHRQRAKARAASQQLAGTRTLSIIGGKGFASNLWSRLGINRPFAPVFNSNLDGANRLGDMDGSSTDDQANGNNKENIDLYNPNPSNSKLDTNSGYFSHIDDGNDNKGCGLGDSGLERSCGSGSNDTLNWSLDSDPSFERKHTRAGRGAEGVVGGYDEESDLFVYLT